MKITPQDKTGSPPDAWNCTWESKSSTTTRWWNSREKGLREGKQREEKVPLKLDRI